jgi:hypothetical protein
VRKLILGLFTLGLLAMLAVSSASAAPGLKLKPTAGRANPPDYNTLGNSTVAQAQWTNKEALDGKFSVLLQKTAPTADYVWAAVVVDGTEGMTVGSLGTLGFSVKGACGGGAPRFNLYFNDGAGNSGLAFYGCGNHISGTSGAWTSMSASALVPDSCYDYAPVVGPCTISAASTVIQLSVIVDEQGTYYVDRVQAAGQTLGEPNGN